MSASSPSGSCLMLCAGLQDNSGWCGPVSSLADHVVGASDWYNVVGGDRPARVLPLPHHPPMSRHPPFQAEP